MLCGPSSFVRCHWDVGFESGPLNDHPGALLECHSLQPTPAGALLSLVFSVILNITRGLHSQVRDVLEKSTAGTPKESILPAWVSEPLWSHRVRASGAEQSLAKHQTHYQLSNYDPNLLVSEPVFIKVKHFKQLTRHRQLDKMIDTLSIN